MNSSSTSSSSGTKAGVLIGCVMLMRVVFDLRVLDVAVGGVCSVVRTCRGRCEAVVEPEWWELGKPRRGLVVFDWRTFGRSLALWVHTTTQIYQLADLQEVSAGCSSTEARQCSYFRTYLLVYLSQWHRPWPVAEQRTSGNIDRCKEEPGAYEAAIISRLLEPLSANILAKIERQLS
jgi:hypothetical protein